MKNNPAIDEKYFQLIDVDDEVYGPQVMRHVREQGPDALYMPEGSKLPQLYGPRIMHVLENRPIFDILKTWTLTGRAKEFSLALIDRGKKVYNMLEQGTMIDDDERLFQKSRYSRLEYIDAFFLECKSFCRHRDGVTVQTTKEVISYFNDLRKEKRIGMPGRKVYIGAITDLAQQTSRPHGKYLMEVTEVLTAPRGEIHHRLKPGERS